MSLTKSQKARRKAAVVTSDTHVGVPRAPAKQARRARRSRSPAIQKTYDMVSGQGVNLRQRGEGYGTVVRSSVRELARETSARVANAALSLSLPLERAAVRVAKTSEPTSLASPFQKDHVSLVSIGADDYNVSQNRGYDAAFAFRNPLAASIRWIPASAITGNAVGYQLIFGLDSSPTILETGDLASFEVTPLYLQYNASAPYSDPGSSPIHGDILACARLGSNPGRWFWMGRGKLVLTVSGNVTNDWALTVSVLYGMEVRTHGAYQIGAVNSNTVTVQFDPAVNIPETDTPFGYGRFIRLSLESEGTGTFTDTVKWDAYVSYYGSQYGIRMLPGFYEKIASVQQMGVMALSVLVRNTSSRLAANGEIVLSQQNASHLWHSMASQGPGPLYTHLSESNRAQQREINFDTGGYIFCRPADSDLELTSYSQSSIAGQVVSGLTYDLTSNADWLCTAVVLQLSDALVPVGGRYTYIFGFGVQFNTADSWFDELPDQMSAEERGALVTLLARLEQVHCNPFHFSDLWKSIKSAGSKILSIAPEIASVAFPEAAPIIQAGAALARSL